ncbi:MAG: C10 family peptidase [Treponema sp.]|nr:C10 family peptidase [Treponema sp.]
MEYLALLKARGNYKSSVEDLQHIAENILAKEDSPARSAVSAEKGPVAVSGWNKLNIAAGKRFGATGSARSAGGGEEAPIELYAFSTENSGESAPGFVLACNDVRVGNILAIVESGDPFDLDNPFLKLFYGKLEGYIDETIAAFDNLIDKDVKRAIANIKSGGNSRVVFANTDNWSDENGSNTVQGDNLGTGVNGAYPVLTASWSWTNGKYAYVPVVWNQIAPYNNTVNAILNAQNNTSNNYLAGCGPVAVGQLMAYYKYPPVAGPYTFDWNAMTAYPLANALPSSTQMQIGNLLYYIGVQSNTTFGTNVSLTYPWDIIEVLEQTGYHVPYYTVGSYGYPYNFEGPVDNKKRFEYYNPGYIQVSIMNNRPVLVGGFDTIGGHLWVMDGIRTMVYTETTAGGTFSSVGYVYNNLWVHCNMGLGLNYLGWYAADCFDTNYLSLARQAGNYSGDLRMLSEVRPIGW